jgi:hypothetical protein
MPDSHEAGRDYWQASARPLESLLFVAPLLLFYEVGVLAVGHAAARNGADAWLRQLLDLAGFGQYFLLPLATCSLLLAWHHARRDQWQLAGGLLPRMWLEAALWAVALVVAAQGLLLALGKSAAVSAAAAGNGAPAPLAARLVGYLGAGIYEELLFRLLLVPPALAVLERLRFHEQARLAMAVAGTSLLFAAAHYRIDAYVLGWHVVWPHGEAFSAASFWFRFAAGAAFATLLVYRGFGIAVGAHALYDLLLLIV